MAPVDLREQLNDLWKTTVDQFDEIKEVVVHNSHVGRKKLDAAFLKRQRDRLFQELGEMLFVAAANGRLSISAEAQRTVERIKDVDARLRTEETEIERMRVAASGAAGSPKTGPSARADSAQADSAQADTQADKQADDKPVAPRPHAADSTAADSTAADSTAADSTAEDSTAEDKNSGKAAADIDGRAEKAVPEVPKKAAPKKKSTKAKTKLDAEAEDGHKTVPVDDEEQKPKRRRRRPRKKAEPSEE